MLGGNWNQWNNWPNQWGWGWSGNAGTVPSADNASSTSSSVDSKVKTLTNDYLVCSLPSKRYKLSFNGFSRCPVTIQLAIL